PATERIAVFDNDGTLWCEKPMPIEVGFLLKRMAEMAAQEPSLRQRQPWRAAFYNDYSWLGDAITRHYQGDDSAVKVLLGAVVQAFSGMTVDEYEDRARTFLHSGVHPALGRPLRDCAYEPMIELLRYLEARGFTNYIASAGDRDFMRTIATEI